MSPRCPRARPLAYYDDDTHARRLIALVYEEGLAPAEILAAELQQMYAELMAELQWKTRPWTMISRRVREQLGGAKTYAWIPSTRGAPRRLRVFRFGEAMSATAAAPNQTARLVSAA